MTRALITGITGQDGIYLSELLLKKGYEVYGLMRRTSAGPPHIFDEHHMETGIKLIYGDIRDLSSVKRALAIAKPDEVYNLAAQSHVGVSFECPEETWEINYFGLGRIVVEAVAQNQDVKIYQASTSEMFGTTPPQQNENAAFAPVSPYAKSKLQAHKDYVVGYRERDQLFICSGILFNHESPHRGRHFVTRKVTHSLAKIKLGLQEALELGNLSAKRDWGHARDYVRAMHLMLSQETPEDFVIATGRQHTVRELVTCAAAVVGITITWEGEGESEIGRDQHGVVRVRVNPKFYRPNEVQDLQGDARKAKEKLGWTPTTTFEELIAEMVHADYKYHAQTKTHIPPLTTSS